MSFVQRLHSDQLIQMIRSQRMSCEELGIVRPLFDRVDDLGTLRVEVLRSIAMQYSSLLYVFLSNP